METPAKTESRLVAALSAARQQQGLTYEDLAARSGLHRTAVSLIERGERHMTLLVFLKLCKALDMEPADALKEQRATPTLSSAARPAATLHEAPRPLKDDRKKK